jgi:Tol biopolymer transport system component
MSHGKLRNVLLGVAGIAALLAYAIACRASFSPDGKKVLFPSIDRDVRSPCVGLYDREAKTTTPFFPPAVVEEGKEPTFVTGSWWPDGKRAIVTWLERTEPERVMVLDLPQEKGRSVRLFTLGKGSSEESLLVPPVISGGRYLVFGGLHRLDLSTGEVRTRELKDAYPFARGGDVGVMVAEKNEEAGFSLGTLDGETLEAKRITTFPKKDVGEATHVAAASPDGARIAVPAEKEGRSGIVLVSGAAVERTIDAGPVAEAGRLGNTAWSPDGKTVYAAWARKVDGKGIDLGFLECAADGTGRPRTTTLARSRKSDLDQVLVVFQIGLSPDGKTLAVPTTYVEEIEREDLALFLVDLSDPARKVTKVPIPVPAETK